MSSAFAAQLCRVTAPDKLPDRLLASGVFRAEGNASLGNQVLLAYLFEVNRPWFSSSELIPRVVAALEAQHAKLRANMPIDDQFEHLLKAINQELNKVSEEGETDWIGSLNGLILVMSGEELHFSQTGRCPAYLLQNNRIRQITDDPAAVQDPHPLRTFANLASGHLVEGDQILIANQELYNEISLDALRRILNSASPLGSSQAIARELKRERNASVTSLILKIENPSALPAVPESEIVSLEEAMQSPVKKLGAKLAPFVQRTKQLGSQAGAGAAAAARQTQTAVKEKVAPKAAEMLKKGAERFKTESKEVAAVEGQKPIVETILPRSKRVRPDLAAIAEKAEQKLSGEELSPVATPNPVLIVGARLLRAASNAIAPAVAAAKVWLKVPRNKRIAALVLGVALISATTAAALSSRNPATTAEVKQENVTLLEQARSHKEGVIAAIDANNPDEAERLADEAEGAINRLKTPSAEQSAEADAILNSISLLTDPISGTVRLGAPSASYALSGQSTGMFANLPYFYGWNGSSALSRTGRGDAAQVQTTVNLPQTGDVIISAAKSSESAVAGYALTRQGNVFRILQNGSSTLLKEIEPTEGDFATGDSIASYNGHVYILDGKTGLLWRYTNSGTQYAKGVSVIDINKFDIKKSVSVAIDGSIWFLKQDGSVSKFTSGKQDAFALKNQPYSVLNPTQPSQIVTNETYSNFYVLDAGSMSASRSTARVIEYGKDGSFVRQFAFPADVTKVRAFDINPKEGTLWVLTDTGIKEFDLP